MKVVLNTEGDIDEIELSTQGDKLIFSADLEKRSITFNVDLKDFEKGIKAIKDTK